MVNNSFFQQSLIGKRVMILAPHQDDEVHVGGGLLSSLKDSGADMYVVYSTNGDYKFKAETRIKEAYNALRVLGIPHDNIIFLGYADGCIDDKHIFFADTPQISPAGFMETYGTTLSDDFAMLYRGKHSKYICKDFIQDVQDVILSVKPDVIFCVDYDHHWDHRMLSLSFDKAMGRILNENTCEYTPQVFKILAYATAYEAVPDFYAANIKSVPIPKVGEVLGYNMDILEYSLYSWGSRTRFPVNIKCRGRFKAKNILFKALCKHMSQGAAMHADYCINGDWVYWQRRTDNLAYNAKITASSGNPTYVRDFCLYGIDTINPKQQQIEFSDWMWIPCKDDTARTLTFEWDEPQNVDHIVIYGNINNSGIIKTLIIETDEGFSCRVNDLPINGRPQYIDIDARQSIKKLSISIVDSVGIVGLNQVEIMPAKYQADTIRPYIKLMVNQEFIYDYWIKNDKKTILFDVYKYACDDGIGFRVDSSNCSLIQGNKLIIDNRDSVISLTAYSLVDHNIYDIVEIHRKNILKFLGLKIAQKLEYHVIKFLLRRFKKYMYLRNKYIKDI